mmetsp:Transcript_30190/g.72958  ORF Transcript_30190/g.72958 Transcript_30190/m.72958 type:complete len:459 (+) Transcript_30190:170-1546(+)
MVVPSLASLRESTRRLGRRRSLYSTASKLLLSCKKSTTAVRVFILFVAAFACKQLTFESLESSFSPEGTRRVESSVVNQQLGKCPHDESPDRWSKRDFPRSDARSLFNCDLPDALCTYYFPADFFDPNCGVGKKYVHFVEDANAMNENGTLWNFMPALGYPTVTLDNACFGKSNATEAKRRARKRSNVTKDMYTLVDIGEHNKTDALGTSSNRCLTERISFVHVHKTGGTSLRSAVMKAGRNTNASILLHPFWQPAAQERSRSKNKTEMKWITLNSLGNATKYPRKEFGANQHVIFAVVRDPVERFISAIGQAWGAKGSQKNRIGPVLKQACLKATPAETLTCMAKYVRDHGFWIELHFAPQAIDISFTTMWQDVPVALFDMKHIKAMLRYFEKDSTQLRSSSANENYRTEDVLKNMTVADYDEETLRIVCEIYEMDVVMRRSLGLEVPRCDPFIPRR